MLKNNIKFLFKNLRFFVCKKPYYNFSSLKQTPQINFNQDKLLDDGVITKIKNQISEISKSSDISAQQNFESISNSVKYLSVIGMISSKLDEEFWLTNQHLNYNPKFMNDFLYTKIVEDFFKNKYRYLQINVRFLLNFRTFAINLSTITNFLIILITINL